MINVITVNTTINKSWLFTVNNWITIHFGANPKNGGNPPKDKRFKNIENFKTFEGKNNENNWLMWLILNKLNIKIKLKDKKV